ncbi:Response regulator transcription factor [Sulfidibacter corallicola]|uniref:Response regulator transcription factor n=1 Tax=Sulfidibacter corallicola TaxID=2818388 RepID=A0A8A4TKY6_SULCO|nr:response regulator transcription factor [Sulfidibacter corallicola]QTD50669.1 response regulator transcription factor [Sulfidibacter corallicola]
MGAEPKKRVLLVEDDPALILGLKDGLAFEGFEVLHAPDGETGLAMARTGNPDLVVLDIMLPRKSGLDVCQALRAEGNTVPIIMLSARGTEIDRVLGLKIGADDYVTKPFSMAELVARMEAIWRRNGFLNQHPDRQERLHFGDVEVDFEDHSAWKSGQPLALTPREFLILAHFAKNLGKVISRREFLQEVWEYEGAAVTRTVDTHMANLRKKIEPNPEKPNHLITVHRLGYKFKL